MLQIKGQTWENASSIAVVLCDMGMQSILTALNSRDEDHLVTQAKGHLG